MGLSENDIISVIIPVFNEEAHLARCLDSVLSQTYDSLEIITVDDGSTDRSPEILKEYAAKDKRIKIISKENGGASTARNMGIEAATGSYIGFVDADDWAEEGMYEALYRYLSSEGSAYEMARIMCRSFSDDGKLIETPKNEDGKNKVLKQEDYFRELVMHEGVFSLCNKLFRSSFLKQYRFMDGHRNEEFELMLRMIKGLSAGVPTIAEVLYNINLPVQTTDGGVYKQQYYEDWMYNAFTACRIARDYYPEYWEEGKRLRLVRLLEYMTHMPIEEMKKDNAFYMRMERFLKSEKKEIKKNRYLSRKQKSYLFLLSTSPARIRKIQKAGQRKH